MLQAGTISTTATRWNEPIVRQDMRQTATLSPRTPSLTRLQSSSARGPQLPIAVVGGGIAGLTAALQLSRRLPPDRRIILYEAQERLGGWIESDVVEFEGNQSGQGTVVLEGGPRSIRPKGLSGWTMIELVRQKLSIHYVAFSGDNAELLTLSSILCPARFTH
jgi:hypothetical protein